MVKVERLRVSGFRNLRWLDCRFPDGALWLVGPNGAGKTSFLEAIYVLSRGSSFRGRRHGPLTTRGLSCSRLDCWLTDGDHTWQQRWTSDKGRDGAAGRASFHVRLVGSAMHALLEGDPTLRRRFVDWNLFHVEPRFGGLRKRYRRVAAQRNAWLKVGGPGRPVWDHEYAAVLQEVEALRQRFFESLREDFLALAESFEAMGAVEPQWRSCLAKGIDARRWLDEHRAADVARGYSFLSPARSDFYLSKDGTPWVGSRGQNKLAGILLQLAADRVVSRSLTQRAVWLVDDLGAELDLMTQHAVLPLLREASDQLVVTSLSPPPSASELNYVADVFHVEQGALIPNVAPRVLPPTPA